MKTVKLLSVAAIALTLGTAAHAGNSSLKSSDGTKLRINCTGSGCAVTMKKPGAKWGTVEKTAGGSQNYEALMTKYKAMGFGK